MHKLLVRMRGKNIFLWHGDAKVHPSFGCRGGNVPIFPLF